MKTGTYVGVVRCHLELKTQQDEPAGGKLPLVQKQTSTEPVFYNLSAPSTKEVLQVDAFQGKNPPAVSKTFFGYFLRC